MELIDFDKVYDKVIGLIPVKQEKGGEGDFRALLHDVLEKYYAIVSTCGDLTGYLIDIEDIRKTIDEINTIIEYEYKGLHWMAFDRFSSLVNDEDSPLHQSLVIDGTGTVPTTFYRMRRMAERRDISYQDLFHLPLSKRNYVANGRFGLPGYPCLYLGASIYACWEEMARPPMSESMVSRLECQEPLRLLDLRVPTKEHFKKRLSYLWAMPVIIASSVVVHEPAGTFKPEYIIPHLIMEFIVSYNEIGEDDEPMHGVLYTSVFKSEDFNYPLDKLVNVALPVMKPLESKVFCKELCRLFKMTRPTCDEIEQAKSNGYPTLEYNKEKRCLTEYKGMVVDYEHSTFGYLEQRINNTKLFPLITIEDK